MIQVLRKTGGRTSRFITGALTGRPPQRQYAVLAWAFLAGAIWSFAGYGQSRDWALVAAGLYLLIVLVAIAAIDARYGIIPDSLVAGLAIGGAFQLVLSGDEEVWRHGLEAVLVIAAALLFRAGYRWLRGDDGLGLGDVKLLGAAAFWIEPDGISGMLLIAVFSAAISLVILRLQGHDWHAKQAIPFGPHLAVGLWWIWTSAALS